MQAGEVIQERFQLIRQQRTAWLAIDRDSGREVLLKPQAVFADPDVAAWLGRSRHPALPCFLGELAGPDQESYYIFEYLPGRTFSRLAEDHGGRVALDILLPLLIQAGRILVFLHLQNEARIMHLDIKPENLLLHEPDQVSLIDFGAAHLIQDVQAQTSFDGAVEPESGLRIALTPDYAAPELLSGNPGLASDLFSLGLTAIHLLTGLPPAVCRSRPLPELLSGQPGGIQRLISSLLHSDPAIRLGNAADLVAGLVHERDLLSQDPARESQHPESPDPAPDMNLAVEAIAESSMKLFAAPIAESSMKPSTAPAKDADAGNGAGSGEGMNGHLNGNRLAAPLICIWNGAEVGCELAAVLAGRSRCQVLVIDADLLYPQADFLLGQERGSRPLANPAGLTGFDMALSEEQLGHLDITALNHLIAPTQITGVRLLATRCSLDHYEYFQLDSLHQVLNLSRLVCDLVIVLCSCFIFDAFTCLCLQAADQVLVPLGGNTGSFRASKRAIDFLYSRRLLDMAKIHYVAFPYDSRRDLGWGTMDELCGGRLAGFISEQPRRRSMKSGATPYAAALDRNTRLEYLTMIRRIDLPICGRKEVQ